MRAGWNDAAMTNELLPSAAAHRPSEMDRSNSNKCISTNHGTGSVLGGINTTSVVTADHRIITAVILVDAGR
jgi:hypothetical protein